MAEKQMTSLEERLNTLEELTKKLENGNLSIDEAISVYSQGMELAVDCKKSLDNLTQKVETAKKNAQEALSDNQEI
ncbi:MAG: exodeoxyribonuclease VII small subunit [Succinatimonas sp.]|jgi:exodeoxyribonuclease VII small subunit|nr:exodeoxyribonuclease VII small subunit [Succinatimonas sp.]MDD5868992.1 exodeoxyribonuclease VII small subunit [Succinatimonas sp.]MDY5722034.1 exodeoxyribonuclease VII small subunit [Succinivibrio sp.]